MKFHEFEYRHLNIKRNQRTSLTTLDNVPEEYDLQLTKWGSQAPQCQTQLS